MDHILLLNKLSAFGLVPFLITLTESYVSKKINYVFAMALNLVNICQNPRFHGDQQKGKRQTDDGQMKDRRTGHGQTDGNRRPTFSFSRCHEMSKEH